MDIYSMTLNEYLEAASSKSPTPGGGCVSAVAAASASAMICMVANLTLGKKGYEQVQEDVRQILDAMDDIMADVKELTRKDMMAFQDFMEAWRLPSRTDEEKAKKKEMMEKAAQAASLVPLDLCRSCLGILKQALILAPIGNKSAISDVGVGVYLAEAALRAAMMSVDINAPLIGDSTFRARLQADRAKLLVEADELKMLALATIKQRMES